MVNKRKNHSDLDKESGHRFQFRDRSKIQRQFFAPAQLPAKSKRRCSSVCSSSSETEYSDNNINAFEYELEDTDSVPIQLSKAKTQANKKHKAQLFTNKTDPLQVAKEVIDKILEALEAKSPFVSSLPSSSYICCDLRYFDFELVVEKFGHFDIIVIDPPWSTESSEGKDPFSLSNQDILYIPVENLSKRGFCFLWVSNENMNAGYECIKKWGYECVDSLVWVKTCNGGKKVVISKGDYFYHSTETCLVGYKCPPGERVEFRSKISNDLIIADIKKNAQKPDQLYTVIDLMMPGSKRIELFASNKNLRKGWLSLGFELGESLTKNLEVCSSCSAVISQKRYKSKEKTQNYCQDCFQKKHFEECFQLSQDKKALHHYHKCSRCGMDPLLGVRFQCLDCRNREYCEECYDAFKANKTLCFEHCFEAYEKPCLGKKLPTHLKRKCISCSQKPIIGPCFICADCSSLVLCQNCFFSFRFRDFEAVEGHNSKHRIEVHTVSEHNFKGSTCSVCGRSPLISPKYKCNQCFNYELCEHCYITKDTLTQEFAHNSTHNFTSY